MDPRHLLMLALLALSACGEMAKLSVADGTGPHPTLDAPQATRGTRVVAFASALDHPRWLYVLPNGDVLVAETNAPPKPDDATGIKGWVMGLVMRRAGAAVPSANRITRLRDTHISAPGVKLTELPAGTINHHWTKNLIASASGKTLYVTVGSNSNVGERGMTAEAGRAAIWEPSSGALRTVVNERDELGSELVPDYLSSVRDGAFYGWPYSYFGQHVDVRVKPQQPELVARALAPDYALGPHTASLGLAYSASPKASGGPVRLCRFGGAIVSQACVAEQTQTP